VSAEQCGYASWSRDTWLDYKEPLLRNTAEWLSEESLRFGIPLTKLTASQAQGSAAGVCGHSDLGSAGCGHSDPGNGYPWDVVLQWARGGVPPDPPKPTEEEEMPSVMISPLSVADIPVAVSLPGPFKAMGVCVDVTTLETPNTQIRAAFYSNDGSGWEVIQVYCDTAHQKVVVWPKKPFSGVSLTRIDSQEVFIVADFGK